MITVERIRDLNDRRRTNYYRWKLNGVSVASVAPPRPYGSSSTHWRALGYGRSTPSDNVELGLFATRAEAEQAVRDYIAGRKP